MRPLAAALLLVLAAASPAGARTVDKSRHLWATVNVCDTADAPDAIGIRGSMPGSGRRGERMYMRFQVQYRSGADGRWHNLRRGGDSGFVLVGHARYKARQAGRSFRFRPRPGQRYVLRGAVTFEWRRGGRTVRRARQATTAGHRSAVADPKGFSAAHCTIAG